MTALDQQAAAATRSYAERVIARGRARGVLPRYGTPEWVVLDDSAERKLASIEDLRERTPL